MKKDIYLSNPVISLYEGDEFSDADLAGAAADHAAEQLRAAKAEAEAAERAAADKGEQPDPDKPLSADPAARFNTDDVNRIVQDRLAKERKRQAEENRKTQRKLEEVLASQSLTEEEKTDLQQTIENMKKQNRTKEEQAKHERKALQEEYENRLNEATQKASYWENEYRTKTIERALLDAATKHEAYIPSQVVTILKEFTSLQKPVGEDNKPIEGASLQPMVDLPDIDAETGKPYVSQRTPEDAVARLTELQPNLFKANVVSGVGGNSTTGGARPGQDGKVDVGNLTTEQFMQLYKKDPSLVGRKRRSF